MNYPPLAHRFLFLAITLAVFIVEGGQASDALAFKGIGTNESATSSPPDAIVSQHGNREIVVARVNGAEITMGALMKVIQEISEKNYGGKEVTESLARQMRSEALEKLALEELAYQRAVAEGISVESAQIDSQVEALKKAKGGEEAFLKHLETERKSLDVLKNEIRRFLMVNKILHKEIDSTIKIDEKEIDEAYLANKESFVTPERVVISDVIFFLDPKDRTSMEKALKVKSLLTKELGNDPTKLQPEGFVVQSGIDISQEAHPELYAEAKKMKPGTVSDPLDLNGTMHLIKLEHIQPRQEKDEATAKKIVSSKLKSFKKNKLLTEWRQNLLKNAKIELVHELLK